MKVEYNFNEVIDRKNWFSVKWVGMNGSFGRNDLLPLWIADMCFKTATPIIESIQDFASHGIYGYSMRPKSYFESISKWLFQRFDFNVSSEEIIFSPGVMCSVSIIVSVFTKEGDSIVIQEPVYSPFSKTVRDNNRNVIVNKLIKKNNNKYEMDFDDLEKKFIEFKPVLFILCNPHNPIGRVWTERELIKIGELCLKYNVKIISDEIHADLVYKPNKHIPIASLNDQFSDNVITLMAPSKTFNLAGLQASYAICKNKSDKKVLEEAIAKIDIESSSCFNLVATQAAYNDGDDWLEQLLIYVEDNIDYVIKYFEENLPKVKIFKPEGTYLLWLDFNGFDLDEEKLFDIIINDAKVALNRGKGFGFGGDGFFRMNVACPRSIIEQALVNINDAFMKY